jgi:Tol biopolymer transport system component
MTRSATVTAMAALVIVLFAPAPAEATFPGSNGPIAYEALPKIGITDPGTGSTDEAVSSGSGPSLFPGSRQVAYIRVVGFEDPLYPNLAEYSIYVKSLHPNHPRAPGRRITGQRAFSVRDLAVAPDGKRIVFVGQHPIGHHGPEFDIWSISIGGSGLHRLTKNRIFDNDVDVSPDGHHVAYVEKVDGRAQVFLMDIDGSHQHRLTVDGRRDRAPHWSPDGRRITYFSAPGKGHRAYRDTDVWSIAAGGGRPRHLATDAEDPVYSPDGRQIAFLRGYAIWLMRPGGSDQRRLSRGDPESEITGLDWGSLGRGDLLDSSQPIR